MTDDADYLAAQYLARGRWPTPLPVSPADPEPLTGCVAGRQDGECYDDRCPQTRDGEPAATGRDCPLWTREEEWGPGEYEAWLAARPAAAVGPEPTAPTERQWLRAASAAMDYAAIDDEGTAFARLAPLIERVRAAERARTAEEIAAGIESLRDWAFEHHLDRDRPIRGHYDAAAAVARSHTKEPE